MSFFELTGVPEQFGVLVLTVCLILVLTPYLAGQDLGLIKIPKIRSKTSKDRLRIIGPIAFVLSDLAKRSQVSSRNRWSI
jgi:hypothetical protein